MIAPPEQTQPSESSRTLEAPPELGPALTDELYVDSHVHLYPRYDRLTFLDKALSNIEQAGGALGVLCLTERSQEQAFAELRDGGPIGPWVFETNGEPFTLLAYREGVMKLIILAGRQLTTSERLEVLALGTVERFDDGMDLEQAFLRVRGSGALAVLPYGVGKWTGERARRVGTMIDQYAHEGLVLGDNAGRPGLGPRPPLFDMAAAKQVTLLPGSDPLPISVGQNHAGTYGLILERTFNLNSVGRQVIHALAHVGPVPHRFGERHGLLGFLHHQIALRLQR
jgi:hypothetical protein